MFNLTSSSKLVPLRTSYVRYIKGDFVGKFLAVVTLSHIYIASWYVAVVVIRRDIQTVTMIVGQILGVLINSLLKRIFSQPRPIDQTDLVDFGMPSNHAQFTAYFCAILIIQICRVPVNRLGVVYKFVYSACLLIFLALMCVSRVYLNYHTSEQVVVGALVGGVTAVIWFSLMSTTIAMKVKQDMCQLPIMRFLRIRNYDFVAYAPSDEYEAMQSSMIATVTCLTTATGTSTGAPLAVPRTTQVATAMKRD